MHFTSLCIALASLASAASALQVTSPSASSYWVQFSTNTIAWSYGGNDPPTVTLQITNSNTTLLNGVFSIAEYVKASLQSFTVTNVTLREAEGYVVEMVNPLNNTDVYARSSPFGVRASGTPPAPVSGAGGQNSTTNGVAGSVGNSTSAGSNSRNSSSFANNNAGANARNSSAVALQAPLAMAALTLLAAASHSVLL